MHFSITNPAVDKYLKDGCGRCPLGGTPDCKVHRWQEPLQMLRQIMLDTGLVETVKWSVPCYTWNNKNIAMLAAFKDYCFVSFFKGALLNDPENLLHAPGENSQASRLLKFTSTDDVHRLEPALRSFVQQAIENEKAGKKINFKKISEHPIPVEFLKVLEENPAVRAAFESLTPGRQRGYLLYFAAPKNSTSRLARIEKCIPRILDGKGIQDK